MYDIYNRRSLQRVKLKNTTCVVFPGKPAATVCVCELSMHGKAMFMLDNSRPRSEAIIQTETLSVHMNTMRSW